jgi:hypothetical protein
MATFDAIAFLGDTLRVILQNGLNGLVSPGNVVLSTPSDFKTFAPTQPAVTIFLYHVGICGELRNGSPRASAGTARRPPLPLELRFLVTPWTQAARDGYRIIGAVAQVLYEHAVLSFAELQGDVWSPEDTVELILESVPVEEHYDIWEPTDVPYRLSLTYLARLVGIDSSAGAPAAPVAVASFPGSGP